MATQLAPAAPACADSIAESLLSLADCERSDFSLLRVGAPAFEGRLLVVVHPGDITEVDCSPDQRDLSEECQLHVAELLETWQGPVAILHRHSCMEFAERSGRAMGELTEALWSHWRQADAMLAYGDDLTTFTEMLLRRAAGCSEIFVTGAYIHPEHGCVNVVAEGLRMGHRNVRIDPEGYYEP